MKLKGDTTTSNFIWIIFIIIACAVFIIFFTIGYFTSEKTGLAEVLGKAIYHVFGRFIPI
jgi:hypothetical protein